MLLGTVGDQIHISYNSYHQSHRKVGRYFELLVYIKRHANRQIYLEMTNPIFLVLAKIPKVDPNLYPKNVPQS